MRMDISTKAGSPKPRKAFAALAISAAIVVAGNAAAQEHPTYVPGRIGSTLGTPDQIAKDRLAVRVLASAPVQQALHKLEALYESDPRAALPDARSTLKRAAAATAMAQAVAVVNQDPDRPVAYWAITSPHSWGQVKVPLAGLMLDNTDNIYRGIPIDGAAAYEIRGKVIAPAPAQETFILHEVLSGASKNQKVRDHEEENGYVALDQLTLGGDGAFTITIDNTPANGRLNHIQSNPNVHDGYLLIRDTLSDWSRENPTQLHVRRISGPPLRPARTEAELAKRAADLTTSAGPYWLAWAQKVFFSLPVNSFTHIQNRVSGWGFVKCGHYNLKDDEALVITLDRRQAASLGFQLSDVWGQGQALNYIEHTGSLSGDQARANADGTYTYAISVADPGVANWLDPSGLHAGTFCARWQKLPPGTTTDDAVRTIEVVKLSDLKRFFPTGAAWVTPAQRATQFKTRMASYERRLVN